MSQKPRKVSLLKTRYEENPYANEDGFSVPIRRKSEVLQTRAPAAVVVGDERITAAEIRSIRTVDSDQFVKLFVAELDRFFDLTPTALRIATILIRDVGKIRVGNGDQVYINESVITTTVKENGLKPPSPASYYRAMEELISKGFIAPSTKPGLFFINPAIFFNGDRVKFVKEIRKQKMTKLERLEDAGQQRLPLDGDQSQIENKEPQQKERDIWDELNSITEEKAST